MGVGEFQTIVHVHNNIISALLSFIYEKVCDEKS